MSEPVLSIQARCGTGSTCVFDGADLAIEVAIVNPGSAPVGFPLSFRQKTGPSIRLIDNRSRTETSLRTKLADLALAEQFTAVSPGQSVKLRWVIKRSELQGYAAPEMNVAAEVGIGCRILVDGKTQDFFGSDTLRIVGPVRR